MDFKKDRKYKFGRFIFIIGTIDFSIMTLFMWLGKDVAIIPFFIGCFIMIIGNAVMVSVKFKCQQADEDAPSVGQKIAWRWYDFKEFFIKKGVLGSILFVALIAAILTTAVFGYRALSSAYEYSGYMNVGYRYNLRLYEEKLGEVEVARAESAKAFEDGDFAVATRKEKEADRFEFQAETYLKESGENYKIAIKLRPVKEQRLETFKNVLAVTVWVPVLFVWELIARSVKKRKKS